jgi:hypothetical protein
MAGGKIRISKADSWFFVLELQPVFPFLGAIRAPD